MRQFLALVLSFGSWISPCWAVPADLSGVTSRDVVSVFRPVSTQQGLVQSWVNAIEQDASGQIWVGTENGLSRLDGHHVFNYVHEDNKADSLPGNTVSDLLRDSAGRLWVVTADGVAEYNARRDVFMQRLTGKRLEDLGLGMAYRIVEDRKGLLWFLTDGGVLAYNPSDSTLKVYRHGSKSLPAEQGTRLFALPDGGLMLSDYRKALYRFDAANDTWVLWLDLAQPRLKLRLGQREIRDLWVSPEGQYWLATASGLLQVSADGREIRTWAPDSSRWLPASRINALAGIGDELWLATEEEGIYRLLADGRVLHVVHQPDNVLSLPSTAVSVLRPLPSGQVWVGTKGGGALLWDPKSEIPKRILPGRDGLTNHLVWNFLEGPDGTLWMAGDRGIDIWDWSSGSRGFVDLGRETEGDLPRQVFALAAWREHIYAATSDGVWKIDPGSRSVERVATRWDQNLVKGSRVVAFSLYADQDALWIGYDDGWERWTPEQSWLSSEVANKLCRQGVTAWARVPSGVLMGGEQAVCLVTAPGDAPVPLPGLSRERMPGSGSAVTALVMHEGRLYVGYSGLGLVAYDPETSRILHHWTAENGLPGNNVSSILFDPQERLWVATQTGLTLFNTGTGEYQKLNELDGLTDSEFNEGAFLRLHDGTFVFGTIKGVVAIRPSRMLGRKEPPMVIATRITALASGQHLDISSHLELPERSSALAVAYSSLEFYHPEAIRYQYRLLGKDGDWIDLGNKSQLVFGNFDSGRYVLALRARRSGQTGWGPVTRMTMRVLAPWWRSAWAVTMYVLLTLLLVGGIGYYRWRLMRSRFAALEQLAASEEKLRLAMDASGQGHWQWHLYDDEILLDRTQQVFGVSMPSSLPLVVFWGMIHVRDRLRVVKAWKGFLFGHEEGFQVVCRLEIGDASAWVEMRGQAVTRDENGMATRVLGTYRNVTAEKEKDARLDLLARAFEDTSEGVVVLDEQRRIIEVNNAALQLSGVSRRQLIGRKVTSLRGSRQRPEDYDKIWEEIGRSGKWQGELWVRTILGEEKPLWVCLSTLEDPSREERHYVAVFSDMSERKAAEEELKFLANYDPLTQLPNRALLWDRLSHALDTARRESRPLALMFLDLDHFKQINDTYGHGAGDKVLIAIADRLRATLRDDDTIARIAGDEFVIILEHFPHLGAIPAVTDKIRKAMTKPVEVEGRQLNVTFSIGVALYPGDGQDATALMKSADIAMYNAKQAGRNQVQFFAPQMQERVRQRLEIESDLRKALKLGELEVWYQPQVYSTPSSSREVVQLSGFEALVRWRHPEKGLISPAEFIPVAEESDLINELGLWVFEQALAQYAAWKSDWGFDGVMSVNLSARQLKIPDLAGHFATILGQSGIGAGRVVLEVTETALMDNLAEAQHTLTALREAGFGVALDDFGSGYSSLNYLRQLPIDYIKIDASFVHNLLESAIDRAIVTAVLEIARVQGLRVLAEGIERMEQKDFLLASGCRYFQGFLFGRPAPPDALTLWLQQYQQEHQPPHGPASS